jgi:hypothetical protein
MGNAELIQPTRIPFSTSAIDAVSTTTCRRYRAGCLRRRTDHLKLMLICPLCWGSILTPTPEIWHGGFRGARFASTPIWSILSLQGR